MKYAQSTALRVTFAAALVVAPAVVRSQPPTPAPAPAPAPADTGRRAPSDAPVVDSAGGAVAGTAWAAQLDSVSTALRGDVTAVPAPVALRFINTFQLKLASSGDEQLSDIAVDLGALRTALSATPMDRGAVAGLLSRLGPKVTAASAKAGPQAAQVRALGESLGRAAVQLRAPSGAPSGTPASPPPPR